MITRIAIENFKGIRKRQEIELRPLTFLFGPNSAGKSTFLHALQYARDIFERHNLDPDRTVAGGEQTDLGGFQMLINGHDTNRVVRIAITVDQNDQLYDELSYGLDMEIINEHLELQDRINGYASELVQGEQCQVEIAVSWDSLSGKPYCSEYRLHLDGELVATITSDPGGRRIALTELNLKHPGATSFRGWEMLADLEDYKGPPIEEIFDDPDESVLSACLRETSGYFEQISSRSSPAQESVLQPILLEGQLDSLPEEGESIRLAMRDESESVSESTSPDRAEYRFAQAVASAVSHFLSVPLKIVTEELQALRYLGPIRDLPDRHYRPPRYPDDARWACGLGAWDLLATGPDSLLDDTSEWLSSSNRLNAGYTIRRQRHKKIDLADPLLIQLQTGRAFDEADDEARLRLEDIPEETEIIIEPIGKQLPLQPHDLGIGISQVVPVIVTALDGRDRLLAIEQPELHLHPRMQAELGDLFIDAAKGERSQTFILETHSEVVPLRIMRRIRNSFEGKMPSHLPQLSVSDVAVYYVDSHESATVVRQLELSEDGKLLDPWPDGFFEEGYRERFPEESGA